jgi:siderophore synthetase component
VVGAADAYAGAAELLAVEALLRCWMRERAVEPPSAGGDLRLSLPGGVVTVPVLYWSATGIHRLGAPVASSGARVGAAELARLLGEGALGLPEAVDQLADRAGESAARVAAHLAHRASHPEPASTVFLDAEQGLLAGHPLHPTPKSRGHLSSADAARFAPEMRGGFPLHWFAVDGALVVHDSEFGESAADIVARLVGVGVGTVAGGAGRISEGFVLVPAHPWQAADLLGRPGIRSLIEDGSVVALGPLGEPWFPTSSVRTVYRPDSSVMLKLSLALEITNSRRENLRKELLRGVEGHRLFAGALGEQLRSAYPAFRVLTDAGYLAVDGAPGLDVSLRQSPFAADDSVHCVAALVDLGYGPIGLDGHAHRLASWLHRMAGAESRALDDVVAQWFTSYLRVLIEPLLWLDASYGVTLEAHQQNTLLTLDEHGYPAAGWYRDNQGFYYRESAIDGLEALSGLSGLGRESETVVADSIVTERLVYYVGINNLFGMIGALGCAGVADERVLLGLAADALAPLRGHAPVDLLLSAGRLRCKANLLTRAAGLDELTGDLATQSVYVEIPNPLAAATRSGQDLP